MLFIIIGLFSLLIAILIVSILCAKINELERDADRDHNRIINLADRMSDMRYILDEVRDYCGSEDPKINNVCWFIVDEKNKTDHGIIVGRLSNGKVLVRVGDEVAAVPEKFAFTQEKAAKRHLALRYAEKLMEKKKGK